MTSKAPASDNVTNRRHGRRRPGLLDQLVAVGRRDEEQVLAGLGARRSECVSRVVGSRRLSVLALVQLPFALYEELGASRKLDSLPLEGGRPSRQIVLAGLDTQLDLEELLRTLVEGSCRRLEIGGLQLDRGGPPLEFLVTCGGTLLQLRDLLRTVVKRLSSRIQLGLRLLECRPVL